MIDTSNFDPEKLKRLTAHLGKSLSDLIELGHSDDEIVDVALAWAILLGKKVHGTERFSQHLLTLAIGMLPANNSSANSGAKH
jgi:hypothetical protein